jgi:hypothetical protein
MSRLKGSYDPKGTFYQIKFCKSKFQSVLPYSLRTSTRTSKRTVRTLLSVQRVHFYKKTSIKIVTIFFSRKNFLKLIIINKIKFLHVNFNKIPIKKS